MFEKNGRVAGLLRYGIPLTSRWRKHIDRRVEQMQAEGVTIRTGVLSAACRAKGRHRITNDAKGRRSRRQLKDLRRRAADRRRRTEP